MNGKNDSYVTPDLLSELADILEEKAEAEGLFDDFSDELASATPVEIPPAPSAGSTARIEREKYLKARRLNPNAPLPESVET